MQVTPLLICTSLIFAHAIHALSNAGFASWPNQDKKAANCRPEASPTVLLVLDPNGVLCWENVAINAFTNATLLPWLHEQFDALTFGPDRTGTYLQTPHGKPQWVSATFREHVEQAWQFNASHIHLPSMLLVAYQMTLLEGSCVNLRLTDERNFWLSVEMSAATGLPVPADVHYFQQMQTFPGPPEPLLDSMQDTVIILPRIVPTLRPVGKAWSKQTASNMYSDPQGWDLETVLGMLVKFLDVTHAASLPKLDEYRVLPDKIKLHAMYQSYYDANPEARTPPIPNAQVSPPLTTQRLQQLCYSSEEEPSEIEQTATVHALLGAIHKLEATVPQGDPVRGVVEGSGGASDESAGVEWMGEYMLKREFSEGSHHVFGISVLKLLPDAPPTSQHLHSAASKQQSKILNKVSETSDKTNLTHSSSSSLRQPANMPTCSHSNVVNSQQELQATDSYKLADNNLTSSAITSLMHLPVSIARQVMSSARECAQTVKQNVNHWYAADDTSGAGVPSCTCSDHSGASASHSTGNKSYASCDSCSSGSSSSSSSRNASTAADKLASNNNTAGTSSTASHNYTSTASANSETTTHSDNAAQDNSADYTRNLNPKPVQIAMPSYLWQMLKETASRLLKESCGESWLLQPKIADMTRLEYRVYLLGGLSGAQNDSSSSVVVYTPCLLDPDDGIRTFNITLPEGTFCSDTMADPSDDPDLMDRRDFTQVTPWSSPETYSMILKAAHDGAEALVKSPRGHLLRTLSHVFVRVDVVLSARWLSDEEVKLMPMVNEMDWLNSAGMLTHFWKDAELPDLPAGSCANADAATNSSNGNVEFALEGDHADAILTADPAAKSDSHLGVAASAASPVSVECSTDTVLRGAGSSMYDVYEQALKHSHGYPVAHALHAEILETWRENTVG